MVFQRIKDVGHLCGLLCWKHLEAQIGTRRAAIKHCEFQTEPLSEVLADISNDIRLCRRGKAENVRVFPAGPFLDETADVPIIGSKIVAPFRNAMGFIEHP